MEQPPGGAVVLLESQTKLSAGDAAPPFELPGTDGKDHRLSEYGKAGLLVIFMCNHCPYVKAKVPEIRRLAAKFGGKIDIVGINSNDAQAYPEDSFEAMKKVDLGIDYLADQTQETARAYGATCTPDPFLFDAGHRLVFHGRLDDAMTPEAQASEKTMEANIESLLAGRPVLKGFDPSIGCSIKWKPAN